MDPLAPFSEKTRSWFERAFAGPTPAQEAGWPAIASGENVLIQAPTGSGKTLAAFLHGIDTLDRAPGTGLRLLYVSPLKALNYDVERNLRGPLAGIKSDLRVGVRTGDTTQKERRELIKEPPDILITTPESLFLMLTSQARETLRGIETVIVDEVHAVAGTKRGAHLALSLERLDALLERPSQRIGLSATQRPLEEIGRFVSGDRPIRLVDAGTRKELDLEVVVPVEDLRELGTSNELTQPVVNDDVVMASGYESTARSIWPSIYPAILELVKEHRSTIVFVNNRRLAERLAVRLNELAEEEIARAHHGSLARDQRVLIEEDLKAGRIPCLVATSSLELGIDMGAVDLVIQVESPKSVARGLQRIGRAGHELGSTSKGRDLSQVPRRPARVGRGREGDARRRDRGDPDPAQPARRARAADRRDRGRGGDRGRRRCTRSSAAPTPSPISRCSSSRTCSTCSPAATRRTSSPSCGRGSSGTAPPACIRGRTGARRLAVTNAGTIPDRGLYGVHLVDGGGRVGELDEEMVYEARQGQTFMLGASTWRIEEITRDRVIVSPAPGVPGAVPFWKGEGVGGRSSWARRSGAPRGS